MKIEKIPADLEPFRLSVSSTMRHDGAVEYHVTSMRNVGSRPKTESWGFAQPQCKHLSCRWYNLGVAARDWAVLAVGTPPDGVAHGEQLGLAYPRP